MKSQVKKWAIASLAVGLISSALMMTQPVKAEACAWCIFTPRVPDSDSGGTGGVGGGGGNGYDIMP